MDYLVREARIEDIKDIQNVAQVTWNHTYDGIIPLEVQNNFLQFAYSDESMKKRINTTVLLVALIKEKVVGFANFFQLNEKQSEFELGAIYVHPVWQGDGIGTKLLKVGIEHLKGRPKVFINVEKENEIGKKFYHAKGFVVVDEFEEDFDDHKLQTIRMMLET